MQNLYHVLGVRPDGEDVVIKAAYRALMLKYHPDTNKTASAKEQAQKINHAYQILSDPIQRANYDTSLKRRRDAEPPH